MGDDKKTITIDLAEYERQQAQTQEALARIVQLEGAMVAAGLAVPPPDESVTQYAPKDTP